MEHRHDLGLAALIDHTILDPMATDQQVATLVAEAVEWSMRYVCVSPNRVERAVREADGRVAVASVIGFPSGAHTAHAKAAEAAQAADHGAAEIDMVISLGFVVEGNLAAVEAEVAAVVHAVAARGAHVKAILETSALGPARSEAAARAALAGGAAWLKTSTGFHPTGGATVADVQLLHRVADGRALVKASGGIRTLEKARQMVAAGALRLGTSAGVAILSATRPSS